MTQLKKAEVTVHDLRQSMQYLHQCYTECRYNDILIGLKRPWDCMNEYPICIYNTVDGICLFHRIHDEILK